jgi:transposase
VIKVDQLHDAERLRSVVVLLDREVDRLRQQVRDLNFENARLRGETAAQVDFGFPTAALDRLLTAALEPSPARPPRPAQPGHGPHPQAHLPVIEQRHELAPSDRECKVCGGQLEPMAGQTEDTEEITVEERSYRLVVHRRQKYRCACNSNVATAPGPPKLIAGGRYSPEFAVHVAVQKYAAHLPLERQVEIMAHQGLETTSQTLWDQLVATAAILKPSYVALGKWLLGQPLLHVDETGWPVNALDTRKPRWTAWCLCTATAAWFRIASSKSEAEGRQLLGGYSGTVVADGYKVYKNLARGSPGYRLAHCWAHYPERGFIRSSCGPRPTQAVETPRRTLHNTCSQGLQEREQVGFGPPPLAVRRLDAGLLPKRLHGIALHLQVGRDIAARRGYAGVAEVVADHRHVGPRLQQCDGTAVALMPSSA